MKNTLLMILLGLALVSSSLASDKPAAQAALPSAPGNQKEKLSYALGIRVGSDLKYESLDIDPQVFLEGIKDAFSGSRTRLSAEEIHAILSDLQTELKAKQEVREAEKVLASRQAAEKNRKDGEAFLVANKSKEGVVTLPSGLQYRVLKTGDGPKPALADTIVCQYRGTLTDGTEFDSSYRRKTPATAPLAKVIKGWSEALQLMPVGSKWQLFIPPSLAYGARGASIGIPPNATLIFEVELLSIKDKDGDKSLASQVR